MNQTLNPSQLSINELRVYARSLPNKQIPTTHIPLKYKSLIDYINVTS